MQFCPAENVSDGLENHFEYLIEYQKTHKTPDCTLKTSKPRLLNSKKPTIKTNRRPNKSWNEVSLALELSQFMEIAFKNEWIDKPSKYLLPNQWIHSHNRYCVSVDIVIPSHKWVIEYDGYHWHKNKIEEDKEKNCIIKDAGYQILRIRENMTALEPHDILVGVLEYPKVVANKTLNFLNEELKLNLDLNDYLAKPDCSMDSEVHDFLYPRIDRTPPKPKHKLFGR